MTTVVNKNSSRWCRRLVAGALTAVLCATFGAAANAAYPDRAVKIVCGSGAGGIVDITARIVANQMSVLLGQPVVVEDMPGAGSTIAIKTVMRADPDGYTLLFTGAGISVVSALYPNQHLDVINELEPISVVGDTPLVLFVNKSVPGATYQELVAYLKANPGKVTSGSNGRGTGSYLAMAYFEKLAGVQLVNVLYKSTPEVLTDLVAGRIGMTFTAIGDGILKSQAIRPVGITALKRSKEFPDVPTFSELGVKDFESGTPTILLAPKGTPKEIVDALAKAVAKSLADPAVEKRLDNAQIVMPAGVGPAYSAKFLKEEIAKWGDILKESKD